MVLIVFVEVIEVMGFVVEGVMIEVYFFDIEMRMQNEIFVGLIVFLVVYCYFQEWK